MLVPAEVNAADVRAPTDDTLPSMSTVAADSAIVSTDDEAPTSAVAVGGTREGQPEVHVHKRPEPKTDGDTAPLEVLGGRRDLFPQSRAQGDHVGNIGWLFGNWAQRPRSLDMREHMETALKTKNAQVIGLAECEAETELMLRQVGRPGDSDAPEHSLQSRASYEYLTIRGSEKCSVMIGLRKDMGSHLRLLCFFFLDEEARRQLQETYVRSHQPPVAAKKQKSYSRCLIAEVTMDNVIGFLGQTHSVMAMHLHHHMANNHWPAKLKEFWSWLAEKLREYNVKVMMGDFNMALFEVVPQLRSRGVNIDMVAWYPWKSLRVSDVGLLCDLLHQHARHLQSAEGRQ